MTRFALGSASVLRSAILVASLTDGTVQAAADYELVSVVVVSRHGVRSPIAEHPPLANVAADPWPKWPVPPGNLTPHGAELARLLGIFYRAHYAAKGLFPANGCPPSGTVEAFADVDQRTRMTAQALLDGMFPGCNLTPGYRVDARVDPLFHPTRSGVCRLDLARARQSVIERAGGSFAVLNTTFRAEIAAMQKLLKCCAPALCSSAGRANGCVLGDLPTMLEASHDGGSVSLSGPIGIGSTAAEAFLLEYAQNFPRDQVAWGRASTPEAMRPFLRLHTLQFDLLYRTPYLADRQGSALLERIVSSLQRAAGPSLPAPPHFSLFVGHDTNLASIGGLLRLHWSLPSYLPDQTPPAGALHFELLRDRATGVLAVRVVYIAQTMDQMRSAMSLDSRSPPEAAIARMETCRADDAGACPLGAFMKVADEAIDRACVPGSR